jgi:transposase
MTEQKRNEIVSRFRGGASIRQIARDLGLARNTVSSVLAQIQSQWAGTDAAAPSRRRSRQLDRYEPAIQELLGRYPDLTAMRLLEELRQRGFSGGYTMVRQRLRELRPRPAPAPVIRFETGPAVQAQMDYAVYDLDFTSEGRRRVYLFSYLLGYSRRQYLRFVVAQDFATTIREHVRAFTHLGGVAATCLYDNQKVVVTGYEDDVPIYNARFLAFATHYGYRPVACRPHRPQTKGKVERPFAYVESSLLNGRSFETLEDLNATTAWWLAHVADVRVLRELQKTPFQLHEEERPFLIPLPAQSYEIDPVFYRTVNVEGVITYRQNSYSVPWRHIGKVLPVRVTETEVIIYNPEVEEIARHALLPRTVIGQRSEQKEHRPTEDARQRQVQLEERFADLGATAVRFLEGLLKAQRYGKDQARRVLALLGSYTRQDLIAALERAVRYSAFSHAAVERILSAQARPKSGWETLAEAERCALPPWLDDTPVPPRPTSDYQHLSDQEAPKDAAPNPPPNGSAADTAADTGPSGTAPADP